MSSVGGRASDVFTVVGFTNWKKAMERNAGFSQHATSKTHTDSEKAYTSFVCARPVDAQLSVENARVISQRQADIQRNRAIMSKLFGVVSFISGLVLRTVHRS